MNISFWKNKKVLLTGHTGFKGSWLSLWLQMMDANLTGISNGKVSNPNLFDESNAETKMQSIIADVRDKDKLIELVQSISPEIIIHMAAQSLVRKSYSSPIETFESNIMGTANLLEAIRLSNITCRILVITSDKCYKNIEKTKGYTEDSPLGGFDPYSSSKACAEIVTESYRSSYFQDNNNISVATARAGNVIGGGDWSKDRLIPDFIRAITQKESLSIRYPNATRPWQHVLDVLCGYLTLIENMDTNPNNCNEAWNFGPPQDYNYPVSYIADTITRLWGEGATWNTPEKLTEPHEAGLLSLDSTKANTRLLWKPEMKIDEVLSTTIEWYKSYYKSMDARSITENQIKQYCDQFIK